MEKPTFQPIGTPVMELDTPALVLDIEALHFNLEQMSSVIGHSDVVIRSHVSTFGCPAIAHLYADRFSGNRGIPTMSPGEVCKRTPCLQTSHPLPLSLMPHLAAPAMETEPKICFVGTLMASDFCSEMYCGAVWWNS